MYQSLRKPRLREVQKELGNFLVHWMRSAALPDTIPTLDVSFMLDSEGNIVAVEKITVPPQMIEFPADVFIELARRMKQEIKFPTLPGKDFYPWGISIEPEDVERGYYRFPGMRVAGYPI